MGGSKLYRVVFALGAVLAMAVSACGGGGSGDTTSTPAPPPTAYAVASGAVITYNTPVPGQTIVPPTPTVITDENKTAIAARGSVEMIDYTDPAGRFTMKVPRGWLYQESPSGFTATLPGDPVAAQVGVYCSPDKKTVADLEAFDQNVMQSAKVGTIPFDAAVPVKVGGSIDAVSIPWMGTVSNMSIDRIFVYFVGTTCAWRIQLTTWPQLDITEMKPILDAMLSSFAFTSSG